ncbi:TPA: phosphonate metabolism protein PhnM [Escherichia coli]|nr:phosphonate metabolism protein PhnM [Escherichia coli]EOU58028.1 phosphonate metabolism protein PhnM [Escherichia coli KTE35]EOV01188.1 phosphonate metabolism protein PhnM [Escherichia coli KTE34]MBN6198269.1 phosphonate metabolism protein PhnM [Escherichia coli]QXA60685.1 phosphonate metabolism protein PhnM [Escherichia coli]
MIINNVKLVLENEVVSGSLEVQNGEIRAFAESQSRLPEAMDGEGGWLLPGLIELHTDNLDKFFTPRPKVDWPAHSAMSSHDALMVASGITTVLDAVAIGDVRDGGDLQTGGGGRHIVCADRRSLHAASRRRANLHSLAHGQGYKRH